MSGVFNADTSEQAEYFRKVLLTLSDDVRVILIKIADRLHNMRTLGAMPLNSQGRLAPCWAEQRALLEAEGVTFRKNGCVDMKKCQWEFMKEQIQ